MSPMTFEPAAITERLASPFPCAARASLPFESLLNIAIARFLRDELHWIQHFPGAPHFEVQVRCGRAAAVAGECDHLPPCNASALFHQDSAGVGVECFVSVQVSQSHRE